MPKFYDKVDVLKKPGWLKIRLHRTPEYAEVQQIVDKHALHTICSSGMCPNKAECWSRRTATFMILGDICTRGCRFCATKTGHPLAPDAEEPRRVAESVALMKLRYVVVTSVTRDDLPDGGAAHWAQTVRAIRTQNPDAVIELLIPDLDAQPAPLDVVVASKPDIIGHNIETVERLTSLGTLLFFAIGGIALFVSLLGVFSSMLSAAHERTSEIGILLALGAQKRDIRRIFLTEAVLLCAAGGVFGLLSAWGALKAAASLLLPGWRLTAALPLLAAVCGGAAGLLPAVRASRMNPIEAMRR